MIALGVSPSPAQVLDALASKLGGDALSQSTRSTMSPLPLAAIKGHVACLSRLIDAAPTSLNSSRLERGPCKYVKVTHVC